MPTFVDDLTDAARRDLRKTPLSGPSGQANGLSHRHQRIVVQRVHYRVHRRLRRSRVSFCHARRRVSERFRDDLEAHGFACETAPECVAKVVRSQTASDRCQRFR